MRRTFLKAALLAGAALAATPLLANPDTLQEALVSTYQNNPTLLGARAQQRGVDEGVPIARADGLPSVNATAQYVEFLKQSSNNFTAPARQVGANVDLSVPIYSGGAVKNSIRAAKTRVDAGQADLRGTEASVFSQAVGAYMDVLRDQAIVGLSSNNVKVLEVNLRAAGDRFEIGDLTRTDVAQSNSRLALARGDYRTAQANLIASRERYIQIVGKPPVDLQPPPPLPGFPTSVEEAEDVALIDNPDLLAAKERSKAAGYDIDIAGAGRLPRLSVFSGGAYTNFLNTLGGSAGAGIAFAQTATTAQAGVRATIPIFQGGRPAAQERRAQAQASATYENQVAVERDVIAQVRSAWSSYQAATSIIATNQTAVDASSLSLEGVRAENTVGNRTILDILDAEQELLRAQVQLVTARRNAYVAGFTLLAAMGRAEADKLGLEAGPLYDPQVNYRRVKSKIWDWAKDPDPTPQATRTVDTPPQDASIPSR